jgi:hypothetical protein
MSLPKTNFHYGFVLANWDSLGKIKLAKISRFSANFMERWGHSLKQQPSLLALLAAWVSSPSGTLPDVLLCCYISDVLLQ